MRDFNPDLAASLIEIILLSITVGGFILLLVIAFGGLDTLFALPLIGM